jgi:hypothetical protein
LWLIFIIFSVWDISGKEEDLDLIMERRKRREIIMRRERGKLFYDAGDGIGIKGKNRRDDREKKEREKEIKRDRHLGQRERERGISDD